MKIVVKKQTDIEKITEVKKGDTLTIEADIRLPRIIEVFGKLIIKAKTDCSWIENRYFRANSSPTIYNWENSSPTICNWANSSPTICNWANSSPTIKNRENSSPTIYNWENSSPTIENWENSSPTICNRENSSPTIYNRENSFCRIMSANKKTKIKSFGFSVCFLGASVKVRVNKKSKTAIVQKAKLLDFFERHGIRKTATITLYKKVSAEFKTQEGKPWESEWKIGETITHPDWNPSKKECGEGKFHACARPFFCDEFRRMRGDKYIAVEIKKENLYEWKDNPTYPHKIGFREGKVLYECDRRGEKIKTP
jgi:hypothetical protein